MPSAHRNPLVVKRRIYAMRAAPGAGVPSLAPERVLTPERRGREHPAPRPAIHRGLDDDAAPGQSTDALAQLASGNAEQACEAAHCAEDRALEIPGDETIERGRS